MRPLLADPKMDVAHKQIFRTEAYKPVLAGLLKRLFAFDAMVPDVLSEHLVTCAGELPR